MFTSILILRRIKIELDRLKEERSGMTDDSLWRSVRFNKPPRVGGRGLGQKVQSGPQINDFGYWIWYTRLALYRAELR